MHSRTYRIIVSTNLILLAIFAVVALNLGKADLSTLKPSIAETILYNIRMPRIIAALSVGMALAISGVLFQSLLNNPLADAYTLGIASGSAFGACLVIYLNITLNLLLPIQPFALVFGLFTIFLVIKISRLRGNLSSMSLILAGIILGSVFSAGLSFLKSIAGEDVESMVSWLMGSLSSKQMDQVLLMSGVTLLGFLIAYKYAKELNIITLGKHEAKSVGVDYDRVYKILIFVSALLTSFAVSLSGIVGFVGLVVPHIARIIVGADNKKIIPLATILGGSFLLIADTLTRTVMTHEIPVGVLTTLVGGPFFIYIYVTNKGGSLND
jgi:iron complex transport system permease protein